MEPAQEGPIFDLACMRSSETRPSWACVSASLRFSCSGLVVSLVTNLTLRDPLSTTRCCGQPSALFQARGQTSTTPRKKPSHVFGTSFTRQAAPRQRGVEIHLSASERLCCPLQALQTSGLASARVAASFDALRSSLRTSRRERGRRQQQIESQLRHRASPVAGSTNLRIVTPAAFPILWLLCTGPTLAPEIG
jgi:hypothetical protein